VAECFTFPIADVRRANRRAQVAARVDRPGEARSGTLDPSPVLDSFDSLRLKPGWKLLAYLMGEGIGGESRVVAVPADLDPDGATMEPVTDRTEAADRPYLDDGAWESDLRLPPQARRRFMTAVDGDGSPWSLLCASLAVRVLLDYAAWWHALYAHDWSQHVILARPTPPRSLVEEPAWVFEGDMPGLWRPAVWVGRSTSTVRFYTYRPPWANSEGVWMHEDVYEHGSYDPRISRVEIAAGRPSTIMF
jgi:hypothetical protein